MSREQLPPHDEEAERALIGSALAYGDRALAHALGLREDEFFFPVHRVAWKAILALGAKGKPIDPVTVAVELRADDLEARFSPTWTEWAMDTAAKARVPEMVEHLATIVRELAATRKLIDVCTEAVARARGGAPWTELLGEVRARVGELEGAGAATRTVTITQAAVEVAQEMDRVQRGEATPRISTGLLPLDEFLTGLEGGDLVVIAGRPGLGKTAIATNVAYYNGRHQVPALMFSLEMRMRKLVRRILSTATSIPARRFRAQLDRAEWSRVYDAVAAFEGTSLFLNDSTRRIGDIVGETRRWHARHVRPRRFPDGRPDPRAVVVVDYAQLVRAVRQRGGNREQEVADITGQLKAAAMDLDVPLFLLAQLNRDCEKEKRAPRLADLRESGSLEQDGSVVIFIHVENDQHRLIIAKNRDDPTGFVPVTFDRELTTFFAVEAEAEQRDPEPTVERPHWSEQGQ